uniref:Myb-like domain-containing protein n=1 Tax=Oryza punctata TaxID=4537 RepID=A0A0E0MFG4_ORYPU
MPRPSATASRFAAFWAADALAGDDALEFSVTKAVVGVSPDSIRPAPEAVRERVALRCLQEVVSLASDGDAIATTTAMAAPGVGMLGVEDASRSCEDLLLRLIREVGSSGSLEKDMLPPFRQDIQKFICIKRPTLPETSFELLRKVYPEITPVVPPSPVEQNGNDQHDNINHDLVNTEKTGFATDGAQLQQDDLANLVNESNTENLQKDAMATSDFHQPTKDSRCFDQPQEDSINTVGVNIRSPEDNPTNVDRHMSVAAEPSLASSADLLGSNTGRMSEQDTIDHTTIVQSQSCGVRYPNKHHYNNGNRPLVASIQSPKDSIHEGSTMQATVSPAVDRSNDALPASEMTHLPEFIAVEATVMTSEPHVSKTHPNSGQHDTDDKANQDVDCGSTGFQTAAALQSEGFNGAVQGGKSEIKDPAGNTTQHTETFEQENSDKAHLEVGCADKVNQALFDDGNIMKNNMFCGGLNKQTALESHGCSMALHNRNSEANHFSEQNIGRNRTEVQNDCCSIPTSPNDVNDKRAKQASNKETTGNTVAETSHVHSSDGSFSGFAAAGFLSMAEKLPFCTQDQYANGTVEGLSEQELCIKCGKDGQLLKCSGCLLAAHDTCFGSSVTFDDSGQLYCPVCFYTKATEAYQKAKKTYCEARRNLSAFLGRKQLAEQHQQAALRQRAANSEDHLNGCSNASKRQGNHQSEGNNLSRRYEEPARQRKKQKTNATSDTCALEVVIEKATIVQNSDVAPMNKHSVVQNNKKQAQVAVDEQAVENAEDSRESGNGNSSHKTTHSSQNKCSPAANQSVEADQEDRFASSQQPEDSDEIEATSSNDSSKQRSPPWRKLRHRKARYQDKDTAMPSNSKKALGHHDQRMASPSRKRNYSYPPKRYSNPVGPAGRRTKLCWTEQEEATLREAMARFTPRDNGPIPWVQILEYGRDVFHRTRLASDLRVKWRNMKKKSGS